MKVILGMNVGSFYDSSIFRIHSNYRPYPVDVFAFGRAVLFLFLFSVFALAERKTENKMIVKYHAAAGGKLY